MFKVLLIHAKGCHHCEELLPKYKDMIQKYPKLNLDHVEFTPDIIPFYNRHIPKKTIVEEYTENNETKKRLKRDANGNVMFDHQLAFPTTLFFHNDKLIGNVVGNLPEQLNHIMESLNGQAE